MASAARRESASYVAGTTMQKMLSPRPLQAIVVDVADQRNHFPRQDRSDHERIIITIGPMSTTAQTRTNRFQASGASPIVSTVFQIGRATNANEKKVAAHLRRYIRPMPMKVVQKQKADIETRAASVTRPSRARWLMKVKKNSRLKDERHDPKCSDGRSTH